jgi:hypothetical protein
MQKPPNGVGARGLLTWLPHRRQCPRYEVACDGDQVVWVGTAGATNKTSNVGLLQLKRTTLTRRPNGR